MVKRSGRGLLFSSLPLKQLSGTFLLRAGIFHQLFIASHLILDRATNRRQVCKGDGQTRSTTFTKIHLQNLLPPSSQGHKSNQARSRESNEQSKGFAVEQFLPYLLLSTLSSPNPRTCRTVAQVPSPPQFYHNPVAPITQTKTKPAHQPTIPSCLPPPARRR